MLIKCSSIAWANYSPPPSDFGVICDLKSARPVAINSYLLKMLKYSVIWNKYRIFYDSNGNPIGYIAWADIVEESLYRLFRYGSYPDYFYEWNEGGIRLFIDFVFLTDNAAPSVIRTRLAELVKKKNGFAYARAGRLKYFAYKKNRFVSSMPE